MRGWGRKPRGVWTPDVEERAWLAAAHFHAILEVYPAIREAGDDMLTEALRVAVMTQATDMMDAIVLAVAVRGKLKF